MLKTKPLFYLICFASMPLFSTPSVSAEEALISKCDWNNDLKLGASWDDEQSTSPNSLLDKLEIKHVSEAEYDAAKPLPSWFEAVEIQGKENGHFEFPLENGKKLVFRNTDGGVDSDSSHYLIGLYPELNAYFFEHSQFEYTDFPLYSKLDGSLLAKFGHVTVKHPNLPLFFSFSSEPYNTGTEFWVYEQEQNKKLNQIFSGMFAWQIVDYGYGAERSYPAEYNQYIQNDESYHAISEVKDPSKNPIIFIDKNGVIFLTYHPVKKGTGGDNTDGSTEFSYDDTQYDAKCYLTITYQP